ncbi:hypothetical protein [Gaetbulibacter saemankumensis]|uniref:hypothetical protein n=1 Tax=Gaetbulibacter saemankumensis TaxID=311208 RepID=UPI000401B1E1|nr:hypothetical protein [Gaetbulibacter saemankumensis]
MKKIIILVIGILISCHTVSNAQEKEYIVTFENDTIYGNVKRKMDYGYARYNFKFKEKKQKKRIIKPSEVKFFQTIDGFDGKGFFESINKTYFLQRIITGKINLYISVGNLQGQAPSYYFSKDGSEINSSSIGYTFSRGKSHTQIRKLIEDKPEILKEFDSLKGNKKNIEYIIKKYNESKN